MVGGGRQQRRIDLPTIIGWAISIVTAALLVAATWGQFRGGTDARLDAMQKQLDRVEGRVDRIRDGRE